MPTPSLLIVPARFKSGKLYSQIPTSGAGDFTVTRATTATRVNSAGLIESVASGIPRLDYFSSGGTVGCPALLVEPSGSNLAFNSQTWDASNNWQLSEGSGRVTVATATSGTLAPDGTSTANAISPTSGNITHYLFSNATGTISYVSGTVYTLSAFFKKGAGDSGRYVQIASRGGTTGFLGNPYANFDLELGTTLTVSGSVADSNRASRIQNYGNGWYRCSLTATCSASSNSTVGVLAALLTTDTNARLGAAFAGNTSDYIFGWGAQLETGSVATSYIPTTTAAVTRNADAIRVSGAVSGSIGQTVGTIYCEFAYFGRPSVQSGPIFLRETSLRGLSIGTAGVTNINFTSRNNAGSTSLAIVTGSVQLNTYYKVAIAYDANGTAAGGSEVSGVVAYVNGVQTNIGTFRVPDGVLSEFRMFGAPAASADTDPFNGRILDAALYTTRLSNAELAALTSL